MQKYVKMQTRVTMNFSIVIVGLIIFFVLFISNYLFKLVEDKIKENSLQMTVKLSQSIDSYIKDINQVAKNLASNRNLYEKLKEVDSKDIPLTSNEVLFIDRSLSDYVLQAGNFSSIPSVNIYISTSSNNYKYLYGYDNLSNYDRVMNNSYYRKMLVDNEKIIYANNQNSGNYQGPASFSLIRTSSDYDGNIHGYIEVQQGYGEIGKICEIGDLGEVFIIDRDRNVFFPYTKVGDQDKEFLENANLQGWQGISKTSNNDYFCYYNSGNTNLSVIIKYENKSLLKSLNVIKTTTFLVILLISLISIAVVFILSRQLALPIKKLKDNIINFNSYDMPLDLNQKYYNNEINLLNAAFQDMFDKLKTTMDREIAANKEEMEARFTALQSQIAPHFIHNVLYLISISAQENRNDDAVAMCKQLSDMLRYIVRPSADNVTLEDEINYTLNYLSMLKNKYEDFLTYDIDIQEEAKGITIPRLVVQPFVENSIQHGFRNADPPWHISIRSRLQEDRWRLEIEDNGSGMDQEAMQSVQEQLSNNAAKKPKTYGKDGPGMNSMGIVNTIMRLQLLYGQELKFEIKNRENGGVGIYIEGPYRS